MKPVKVALGKLVSWDGVNITGEGKITFGTSEIKVTLKDPPSPLGIYRIADHVLKTSFMYFRWGRRIEYNENLVKEVNNPPRLGDAILILYSYNIFNNFIAADWCPVSGQSIEPLILEVIKSPVIRKLVPFSISYGFKSQKIIVNDFPGIEYIAGYERIPVLPEEYNFCNAFAVIEQQIADGEWIIINIDLTQTE